MHNRIVSKYLNLSEDSQSLTSLQIKRLIPNLHIRMFIICLFDALTESVPMEFSNILLLEKDFYNDQS